MEVASHLVRLKSHESTFQYTKTEKKKNSNQFSLEKYYLIVNRNKYN